MRPVFDTQSRIQYKNGIHFYEKDIVKLSYELNGDVEITAEIDYFSAGFGFMFEKASNSINRQGEDTYLIKLGNNNFSVYRKQYDKQERLMFTSCNYRPIKEKSVLRFIKKGQLFEVYHEQELLGRYLAPSNFARYNLYVYSNAGNRLRYITINGPAPDAWITNIENTNGGRIEFTEDQIRIENCEKDAEVEQHDIYLAAGRYYLDYILVSGSVEPVVFLSSNASFKDERKNLLNNDLSFDVEQDDFISVKFKSSACVIRNIAIKEAKNSAYVSTGEINKNSTGSYFDIILDEVKKATWKAVIHRIPETEGLIAKHSLIETSLKKYTLSSGSVLIGEELNYEFDVMAMTLKIINNKGIMVSMINIEAAQDEKVLRVFRNLDATVRELVIINMEDQDVNVILQETYKTFIPSSIKSPVLCVDEDEEPLDLSSSFRETEVNGIKQYVFTNWEREYFYPGETFALTKEMRKDIGSIVIHGIRGKQNWDAIYKIEKGVNDVNAFAVNNTIIHPNYYEIDKENNIINLDEHVLEDYDLFIVDYLKDRSYCVNFNKDINMYEADVSISGETAHLIYDYSEGEYEGSSSQYYATGINPNTSQYIILREGVL